MICKSGSTVLYYAFAMGALLYAGQGNAMRRSRSADGLACSAAAASPAPAAGRASVDGFRSVIVEGPGENAVGQRGPLALINRRIDDVEKGVGTLRKSCDRLQYQQDTTARDVRIQWGVSLSIGAFAFISWILSLN